MGKAVCDVKGGLHALYAPTLTQMAPWSKLNDHRYAAQMFAHKGNFEARTLLNALLGAVAGGTATLNYAEIEANVEMGGRRNIVNTSLVNRVTTAADVTDLKGEVGALSANTFVPSPVFNGDRNPLGTR